MEFDSVVKKRKSVRSFATKKVSWKRVIDAIDAALQGPYANNHNHLHFLIIEDEEKIKSLAKISEQLWIAEAGIVVVVCSDDSNLENMYGDRGRVYSRQQAGAAISTFLLKISDMGLASCWVGSYSDELIKGVLGIPQHVQVEAILPVGYEQKESRSAGKPKKREIYSTIYWENWEGWRRPPLFQERKSDYAVVRAHLKD